MPTREKELVGNSGSFVFCFLASTIKAIQHGPVVAATPLLVAFYRGSNHPIAIIVPQGVSPSSRHGCSKVVRRPYFYCCHYGDK